MKTFRMIGMALVAMMLCFGVSSCENNDETEKELSEYVSNQELESLDCYTDIHLHLDGSMTPEMIKELARIQNMPLPYTDEELKNLLQVDDNNTDLNEYLEKFDFPQLFLQTKEGLSKAVELLCKELYENGVIYAEIRFAPQFHCAKGMTQRETIEAAIDGTKNSRIPVRLILCCMRGSDNHEKNLETIHLASEYLDKGVGAVDIAGAEALFPTENFAEIFQLAREMNIPFTIHAGEAAGPESVRKAIEFGARRIGHGVRSAEDEALMAKLKEEGIVLECCPTSNLQTAIYNGIEEFPYHTFFDKEVKFTINSDNMSVSNTTVKKEFIALNNVFGIKRTELLQLLMNSVDAAFITDAEKAQLKKKIEASVMN